LPHALRIARCTGARTTRVDLASNRLYRPQEHTMYIGGGILGTILVILLIVYLARRV
jgi:hypothetical protein